MDVEHEGPDTRTLVLQPGNSWGHLQQHRRPLSWRIPARRGDPARCLRQKGHQPPGAAPPCFLPGDRPSGPISLIGTVTVRRQIHRPPGAKPTKATRLASLMGRGESRVGSPVLEQGFKTVGARSLKNPDPGEVAAFQNGGSHFT